MAKQWEAQCIQFIDLEKRLNDSAADGWEVFTILRADPYQADPNDAGEQQGWLYVVSYKPAPAPSPECVS